MNIKYFINIGLLVFILSTNISLAGNEVQPPRNLFSPAGISTDSTLTVLWDKPIDYSNVTGYEVFLDGNKNGVTSKTNYTFKNLEPGSTYVIHVRAITSSNIASENSNTIKLSTPVSGKTFNIKDFGAIDDSAVINTASIQKAINACTPGGTVLIPSGTFVSGALFLKSNMTLFIAKGGILKGSSDLNDYYPLIPSRFEGWEVKSFASLITIGIIDNKAGYTTRNIAIRGEGKIYGGGNEMAKQMIQKEGIRSRNRLICIQNCENVDIQGLVVENSPCWTIHYIYSKNVVCRDLRIYNQSNNGDGIDPDSSIDSYIFNCWFLTGDDCIAIKSGKNPEGNLIARPTENIRITNCEFVDGHSLAIGSELSGGIKNVFVQDCKIGALDNGFRIKTNKFRGGYVENVVVRDCDLLKILITTIYTPNNDGEPAKEFTDLKNIEFTNLNMQAAPVSKPVIAINGFNIPEKYFKNIMFTNVKLPVNATVAVKYCDNMTFKNVKSTNGLEPMYNIISSVNINH